MPSAWKDAAWPLGLLAGAAGLALAATGRPFGWALALLGAAALSARGVRERADARAWLPWALAAALAGLATWSATWPATWRVATGALAAQALLLALGLGGRSASQEPSRLVLPTLGHATALVASALVVLSGGVGAASGIAYACGLTLLALHAFWTQGDAGGWEPAILLAALVAMAAGMLHDLALAGKGAGRLAEPWLGLASAGAGLLGLGVLSAPPRAPRWVRSGDAILMDVASHGVAGTVLLNVLFLTYSLVATWSVRAVLALILVWSAIGVHFEYRNVAHFRNALRRGDVTPAPLALPDPAEPITVVVPAANEAAVLPESLAANLAVPYPLRFLLVPAVKSKDATVEVAYALAAAHPDRVRVVEGVAGSKAEDLNLAWAHVDTPLALVLDADETIDEDSLAWGLRVLREQPGAGVVQGRKVSRAPEESGLARFISTERRYSTGMDTVMHAQQFGSTHFGGSAALLRTQAARDLGGWTTLSMTEDIDFTLRMHLDGRWRIAYEPRMIVRESDPRNLGELLRQRTRWSRGWIQCVQAYLPGVLSRRRELGTRRAAGLTWMLLTSVAALWTTLFPATVMLRLAGLSLLMPVKVALLVALLMLPARLVSYGYGAARDPVIPIPRSWLRRLELVWHAYLWILFGWFVSLHALYLEAFSAPRVWYVTGKKAQPSSAGPKRPSPSPARA
jgi:cellulose synthase/poly-beta-1,6-N-acetylglucosamine synthase-like glycosyltransferase